MLELKIDDSIYRIRIYKTYIQIKIKYQNKYYSFRASYQNRKINWDDKRRKQYLPYLFPIIPLSDRKIIEKYIKHLAFI